MFVTCDRHLRVEETHCDICKYAVPETAMHWYTSCGNRFIRNRKGGHRSHPAQGRTGGGGVNPPPPPKFRRPSKIMPNSTRLWTVKKNAEFRTPTPQDVRKKGSKILKLPPVRNCFTSAMTNKLVVIINSLKVPKIMKILLYEMKFLVPNFSCLQNPWLGGLPPPDPNSLCPQPNLLNPPPPNEIPVYATETAQV